MTLEKAIEILSGENFGNSWPTPQSETDAVKLGNEALKAWRHMREGDNQPELWELPGETKD